MRMKPRSLIDFHHLAESPAFAEFTTIMRQLTGFQMDLYSPDFVQVRRQFDFPDYSPLCQLIRATADGLAHCEKCDRQHFGEATRLRKGISYLCHAGLTDFAIPIFHHGRLVAVISCGQIRPEPGEEDVQPIIERISHLGLPPDKVKEAYLKTRYLDPYQIEASMKLMAFFAEHLCEVGQQLLDSADGVRKEVAQAMEYVRENFPDDISRDATAARVNLSPAYFSHLFHKATGVSFTDYVQQIRIGHAKQLLEQTSLRSTDIAFRCGFNNITHFNRVFHKIEGCTTREYRANVRQKAE